MRTDLGTPSIARLLLLLGAAACTGEIAGAVGDEPAGAPGERQVVAERAPESTAGGTSAAVGKAADRPAPPECRAERIRARIWRLTPEQYAATVADLFGGATIELAGVPRDQRDGRTGFANSAEDLFVSGALATALFEESERLAGRVGGELARTQPCFAATPVTDDCVRRFVDGFGRRALRRPLAAEELGRYLQLYRRVEPEQGARGAAEAVVQGLLLAPSFSYRTELGADGRLTPWEIASALSYGLTDGPPDDALMAAAAEGRLADPAQRRLVAQQLAATDRARRKMARFMYAQIELHRLEIKKDTLGAGLYDALAGELDHFVREVMGGATADLRTLLTAPYSYVDATTARLYGLSLRPTTRTRVDLPREQRFGVLTQPGWLTAVPTHTPRGHVLRETFLCAPVPPPPEDPNDLAVTLPPTPKEWTEKERFPVFEQRMPACAGCHRLFEPLGFAFERYDATGRHRTANEFGRPIDPSGEVAGAEGWSGRFSDARDLVEQILTSRAGQACFASRYMTYVLGREVAPSSCAAGEVTDGFAAAGLALRALLEGVAGSDLLVARVAL